MTIVPEFTPKQGRGVRHRRTLAHTRERHRRRIQPDPFEEARNYDVERMRRHLYAEALLREGLTVEQRALIKEKVAVTARAAEKRLRLGMDTKKDYWLRRQEELERLTGY